MMGKRTGIFWQCLVLVVALVTLAGCSLGGTPADEVKSAFESHEVKSLIANYQKADENKKIEYVNAYRKCYGAALEKAVQADRKGNFFEESGLKNWQNLHIMGEFAAVDTQEYSQWTKTAAVKVEEFLRRRQSYEAKVCAPVRKSGIKADKVLCVNKYLVNRLGDSGQAYYGCNYSGWSLFSDGYPNGQEGCVLDFSKSGYTSITEGVGTFWVMPDGTEKLESGRGFVSEVPRYKVLPESISEGLKGIEAGREELDKLCNELLWSGQKIAALRPLDQKKPAVWEEKKDGQVKTPKNDGVNGKAQADLQNRGLTVDVQVTTYGKDAAGYLAVVKGGSGMRILAVDVKNNRVAEAVPYESAAEYEKYIKSADKYGSRMIVEFLIKNDSHGADDEFGVWEGSTHRLPIYGHYKVVNGEVEPGMLTSGAGRRPSHFQGPLQEMKNVDIMNMFLEQIYPLLNAARGKGVDITGIHK